MQVNDSLDPGSWRVDSAIIESDGLPLSNDDGTETVTIRGPLPEAPGQPRFLRLRVTEE
ncbi:MAG: hypothetical protein JJT96_10175 [Opitutales bacterium]|nr:hypothetical protein [Opitutales bacterium]